MADVHREIVVRVPESVARVLDQLTMFGHDDKPIGAAAVLREVADRLEDGATRPGAWEAGVLHQLGFEHVEGWQPDPRATWRLLPPAPCPVQGCVGTLVLEDDRSAEARAGKTLDPRDMSNVWFSCACCTYTLFFDGVSYADDGSIVPRDVELELARSLAIELDEFDSVSAPPGVDEADVDEDDVDDQAVDR